MTRGARHCRFSSLRRSRLAARLSRRLCTRMSSTMPSWSTARRSQCFLPAIFNTTSSRCLFVSDCRQTPLDLIGEVLAKLQRPLPHALVADDDAARRQHLLDHAQAEREPEIQPDSVADDLGREAIAGIAGANGCRHPLRLPALPPIRKPASSQVDGASSPVPEPPSLALLTGALGVLGFGGGVAVRRRARTIRQSLVNAP